MADRATRRRAARGPRWRGSCLRLREQRQSRVIANVWDWDPAWTVLYYENGARRGAMERRTGIDPLARQTREHPKPTRHLFYASRSADARHVLVEATDRWGRTYTATPRQA